MEASFVKIEKMRRSIYHLGKNVKADPDDIVQLIKRAAKLAPTPFNIQEVRVVILLGDAHERAWDIIDKVTKKQAGAKVYPSLVPKLRSFKAGLGTALFYTDTDVDKRMMKKLPNVPDARFFEWSEQAQGMSQFAVWTALAERHIGASIHHYGAFFGPKVTGSLSQHFNIPSHWRLRTEMVFGSIEKPAQPKSFIQDNQRFKIIH